MTQEEMQNKLDNAEPEIKNLIAEMNEFILPKFQELQEKLTNDKPSILKILKISKDFSFNMQKEYLEKFGRNLEDDMIKTNDFFGNSKADLSKLFKNFGL